MKLDYDLSYFFLDLDVGMNDSASVCILFQPFKHGEFIERFL